MPYVALLQKILEVVDEQAEDEGLWFDAETAPEAYLQQALRRLHAVIEKEVIQCPRCDAVTLLNTLHECVTTPEDVATANG